MRFDKVGLVAVLFSFWLANSLFAADSGSVPTQVADAQQMQQVETLIQTLSMSDLRRAEEICRSVMDTAGDQDTRDYAQAELGMIALKRGDGNAAELIFLRLLRDRWKGSGFARALLGYAQLNIDRFRPRAALNSLQKLKMLPQGMPSDYAEDKLDLLVRLYVYSNREMRRDTRVVLKARKLRNVTDILYASPDHLLVLDRKGLVFDFNVPESGLMRTRNTPQGMNRLNVFRGHAIVQTGKRVLLVDAAQMHPTFKGEPLTDMIDAAWTSPGEFWILDGDYRGILVFDAAGKYVRKIGTDSFSGHERVCVDPRGGTWILRLREKKIQRYDAMGNPEKDIPFVGPGYEIIQPVDICSDSFGHLYILDAKAECVFVLNRLCKRIARLSFKNSDFRISAPVCLSAGDDGSIFIGDQRTRAVYKFN